VCQIDLVALVPPSPAKDCEVGNRDVAAGVPLLRVTLHCGTLHLQFLRATFTWWRTSGRTQPVMIAHEVADLIPPLAIELSEGPRSAHTPRGSIRREPMRGPFDG
jgi:hypothetical protein